MIIFLYSDKNYEQLAINCIKSFENKITDDIKVVYYTVDFDTEFKCKNLYPTRIGKLNYPSIVYYKPELSLNTINNFPEEDFFLFIDADILFSKRLDFKKLEHNCSYPLGSFGPFEYPYKWSNYGGIEIIYDETNLMNYFNVDARSIGYQGTAFYGFNRACIDFLEEWQSICKNEYLTSKDWRYLPYNEETAFNICLWKRGATESYGYIYVNTILLNVIRSTEESNDISNTRTQIVLDSKGNDWTYINDSSTVIFYHGFKEIENMTECLNYLLSNEKK
jgi:hypothetical protein